MIKEFKKNLEELRRTIQTVQANRDSLHKKRMEILSKQADVAKAVEALGVIQEQLASRSINFITELLNFAFAIVYSEREVKVSLDIGDRANHKTIKIWLSEGDPPIVTALRSGCAKVIVALIFQIITILNKGSVRIIFIDELFTEVSEEYFDGLWQLLRILHEEFDFDFFLVTHDNRAISRADRVYRVSSKGLELVKE